MLHLLLPAQLQHLRGGFQVVSVVGVVVDGGDLGLEVDDGVELAPAVPQGPRLADVYLERPQPRVAPAEQCEVGSVLVDRRDAAAGREQTRRQVLADQAGGADHEHARRSHRRIGS